jgi:tetratricopeptide (TPR) repeat protein
MRRRTSLLATAAILVLLVMSGRARAEQQSTDDDQKARELFRMGENHYAAGRYEKAAVLYDEAFRLSGRPELLLALVNTYERMGDYAQAIEYLRQYLKHPKAKNVSSLRERLRRLENAEGEREAERERLRRLETSERERDRELRRLRAQDRRRPERRGSESAEVTVTAKSGPSRMPAYLFLAGGAVGLAGAVGFGIASGQAGQDAELECGGNGLCRSSADDALDRERRYAILSDVSAAVGLGSAAVGAYLLWKRRDEPLETRRAMHLTPAVLPNGLGVGLVTDF